MKIAVFYFSLVIAIAFLVAIGLRFHFNIKAWLICAGVVAFIIWNKDIINKKNTTNYRKTLTENPRSKPPITSTENRQPSMQSQKEGYLKLAKLCAAPKNRDEIFSYFNNLNHLSDNKVNTLYDFIDFLYEKDISFIMSFDWKSDIENFENQISLSLAENFDSVKLALPKAEDFDPAATISWDGVFEKFDNALRNSGLQFGFLDTESDEYIMLIHRVADKEMVKMAVEKTGFNYFEKYYKMVYLTQITRIVCTNFTKV